MSKAVESFGKYLLLERLAAGGMAEVYLAKSLGAGGIGKFVAIKRILPQYSDSEEFINMFKEEAKIVMNLNHGNVVSIYDFGIEKSQFFLAMEFVEGQNLRQVLNHMKKVSKYFTLDQMVYMVKEVAAGLDHAHRCIDASTGRQLNITHRDMSPQNIMVSFEGEVKVVDFGIAKTEAQLSQTRAGTIKGKFGYMSPEQAEGLDVDARTDVFSLGIILWELLAQDRLFTAQSEHATLKKIKECLIPPIRKLNPAVPPELEKIVMKALTRDRNLRYQTAEAFSKELNRFLNTQYPDFSKQEFSKFMKQIFHTMFLENRKKLAEYAKLEAPKNDKKNEVGEFTKTESDEKPSVAKKITDDDDQPSLQLSELSQKVDLSKLVDSNKTNGGVALVTKRPLYAHGSGTQVGFRTNTQINNYKTNSTSYRPNSASEGSSNFLVGILIAASLCAGGWWYLQNQKRISPNFSLQALLHGEINKKQAEDPNAAADTQTLAMNSKTAAQVPLKIESTPSGAQVYLNDIPIGLTPLISHVESGKPFKIRLIHDGYLPNELFNEVASSAGYSKNLVLMQEPPAGYVTIDSDVKPGQSVVVLVNGQTVARYVPFQTKIPAGTPVSVVVVNPYEKLEGTETIIVAQGQNKKVNIHVNKPARIVQ